MPDAPQPFALLLDKMKAAGADGLQLPPPVFKTFGAEVVGYDEGRSLTVRFPVERRWQNPMGMMQGGVLAALVDNVLGPLSYLVAPPSVTTELNVTFVRPVTSDMKWVEVCGEVVEVMRTRLVLKAEVTDPDGRRLALAQAACLVVGAGRAGR